MEKTNLSTQLRTHSCNDITEKDMHCNGYKQLKKLYESGKSAYNIGKQLGLHHGVIIGILKKLNVRIRNKSEAAKLSFNLGIIKPPINTRKILKNSYKLNKEKAYILGTLCGDAYMHCTRRQSYQIGLDVTDKEFAYYFFSCINNVYGLKPKSSLIKSRNPKWKQQYKIRLCSKKVFEDLKKYDKKEFKTFDWTVPNQILNSNNKIQASFLQAFFDSEGWVEVKEKRIRVISANKNAINQIKDLLTNMKIRSTSIKKENNIVISVQDQKSIKLFYKNIGFRIERKMNNLKILVDNYINFKTPKIEVDKMIGEMLRLKNDGLGYESIAKKLSISTATVWNHLNKYMGAKNV